MYPSASAVRFTGLLQAGAHVTSASTTAASLSNRSGATAPLPPPQPPPPYPDQPTLRTGQLHSLVLGLESFFLRASDGAQSESFEDLNIPVYVQF